MARAWRKAGAVKLRLAACPEAVSERTVDVTATRHRDRRLHSARMLVRLRAGLE